MRPIYVFDRWGNQVDTIAWPLAFEHEDELSGDDAVDLEVVRTQLAKEQRIVWRNRFGEWKSHVVSEIDDTDSGGEIVQTVHAECVLTELITDFIEEREPQDVDAKTALTRCLEGTRFKVGNIDVTGTASFSWYRCTVHDALKEVFEAYEGEYQVRTEVDGSQVVGYYVDFLKQIGTDRGRLYVMGRNLDSVSRTVAADSVITALYGFGKSMQTEAGGQSRKLDFGSINGGKMYVEDNEAKAQYGLPDGRGGTKHTFAAVEFSDCEDAAELKRLTEAELKVRSKPIVTYEVDAVSLMEGGVVDADDVRKGDVIHVRDEGLGIRTTTRVLKVVYDELNPSNDKLTFGTRAPTLTGKVAKQQKDVDNLVGRSGDWDTTSHTVETVPGEWLQQVMDRLNEEFDNAGYCYKYTSLEKGDIYSTVPLDENGKPTKTPASAIQLCGLGFRIANSVKNGDFDWKTFGTGEGFTATLINVGRLQCGDNYIDLDTGEMRIALTAKVGSGSTSLSGYVQNVSNTAATNAENSAVSRANANTKTYLEDYVQIGNFDGYLTLRNVFNALTHNGVDKGLFLKNNQVFISGDYIQTGVIISQDDHSVWDLNHGYFETSSSGYSGGQFHNLYTRIAGGQYAVKMDQTDIGTISTYSQGNYHPFGIKVFTDLVLSAPGALGVSYNATTDYGLSYTNALRNTTITYVENVTKSGDTITATRKQVRFMHGIAVSNATTTNATFSTPLIEGATLAASVETATDVTAGGAVPIDVIATEEGLMEAADESRIVWQVDPDTFTLGIPVYTGEEWTMGVPTVDPVEPEEEVSIPSMGYVDAQAALIQTELEAVAETLGDAKLKASLLRARTAIQTGDSARMTTIAQGIAKPITKLDRTEGVTDA